MTVFLNAFHRKLKLLQILGYLGIRFCRNSRTLVQFSTFTVTDNDLRSELQDIVVVTSLADGGGGMCPPPPLLPPPCGSHPPLVQTRRVLYTELQLKSCNPRWTGTWRLLGVTRKRVKASAAQLPFRFPGEHDRRIKPGPDLRHWGKPTKRWERFPAALTSCSSCDVKRLFAEVCLEWGESLLNWNHLRSRNKLQRQCKVILLCKSSVAAPHSWLSLLT